MYRLLRAPHVAKRLQTQARPLLPQIQTFSTKSSDLPPTFIEKYNLSDPTRFVPLTAAGFLTASATGLYHWDAESQMLGLFMLFVGTIYSQGGAAIAEYFDSSSKQLLDEIHEMENKQIIQIENEIAALKEHVNILDDLQGLATEQEHVLNTLRESGPMRFEVSKTKFFEKRLHELMTLEKDEDEAVRERVILQAKTFVEDEFAKGKASIGAALEVLEGGEDVDDGVSKAYKKFLDGFKTQEMDKGLSFRLKL
eukprot:augustus_masked-scaffold_24-processed-gene-3.44-mRNA-1 protein AED:1.00 eAED:1.00 QI:0/-1/0/0/-1/1/1/0/252